MSGPPILNYAPAPRFQRRTVRRIILLSVLLALGLGIWLWGPAAWRGATLLYWQHRCMTYSPPPDQVVLDTLPPPTPPSPTSRSLSVPSWAYTGLPPLSAAVVPREWAEFARLTELRPDPTAMLFLHERTSPSGGRRLVAVQIDRQAFSYVPCMISAHVIRPVGLSARPAAVTQNIELTSDLLSLYFARRLRFFAGQPDPDNAAHFTIAVEAEGAAVTIDGYLTDDDRVVLRVRPAWRPGPTTAPK